MAAQNPCGVQFADNIEVYNQMKICITQAFMFLNEYEWIANSYVAVSFIKKL